MTDNRKKELFESVPVPKALAAMAVPTIISQLINLIYNMVDAFFIGRTGNPYMTASTTLTLTLVMLNVALSNLFGIGGGSLIARLMGAGRLDEAKKTSAFSVYGCIAVAAVYSLLIFIFMEPVLNFLGASETTFVYARNYTLLVVVAGSITAILSMTLSHLLRNAGYSSRASFGLSLGGVINMVLDPLFMFVILPRGNEVTGAALATLISNVIGCGYLIAAYMRASSSAPLSAGVKDAFSVSFENIRKLFSVGVPSAILTGLFDLANVCLNILSSAHGDIILAGMGIVMKIERLPNAVNIGICQGMLPIVAYNYASGDRTRMHETIKTARICGLAISAVSIAVLEIFAAPASGLFMASSGGADAALTVSYAAMFLRIRCTASPVQFINYHTSFCMQAMGEGKATMIHAAVRELVFYIPIMFILDLVFGEKGLASALPVGEFLGAVFALILLSRILQRRRGGI